MAKAVASSTAQKKASVTPQTAGTSAILAIPPGVLNDIGNDPERLYIDTDTESAISIIRRSVRKSYIPNFLRNSGPFFGIVLRVENDPKTEYDAGSWADRAFTGQKILDRSILHQPGGTTKTSSPVATGAKPNILLEVRVRIPELHSTMPVPNKLPTSSDPGATDKLSNIDNHTIDQYPVFTAVDDLVSLMIPKPGDIVRVDFGNKANMGNAMYLGPVFGAKAALEAWIIELIKKFNPCGKLASKTPSGDDVLSGTNLKRGHAGLSKLPSVAQGEGHGGRDKVISSNSPPGDEKFFQSKMKTKDGGFLKGTIWTGRLKNNGISDAVAMPLGQAGRGTFIYMPAHSNPSKPIEVLYWFHGIRGYVRQGGGDMDFKHRIRPAVKTFAKQGRNIIVVVPEQLWSRRLADKKNGIPRQKTRAWSKPKPHELPSSQSSGWTDREWAAWGFRTDSAGNKDNSDFGELHKEVLAVLKNNFRATNIAYVTAMGHSAGGASLGQAGRMGQMSKVKPNKIVFSDSDYGSGKYGKDGDVMAVFNDWISKSSKNQLVIHTQWKMPHDPTRGLRGFMGLLYSVSKLNPKISYKDAVVKVKEENEKVKADKDLAKKYSSAGAKICRNAFKHKKGEQMFRLPPPFSNVLYVGWAGSLPGEARKTTAHTALARKSLVWVDPGVPTLGISSNTQTKDISAKVNTSKTVATTVDKIEKLKKTDKPGDTAIIITGTSPSKSVISAWNKIPGTTWVGKMNEVYGGQVAISVPDPIDPAKPVELMYYFHGDGGSAASTGKAHRKRILEMAQIHKRNIVIVAPSLNHIYKICKTLGKEKGLTGDALKEFKCKERNSALAGKYGDINALHAKVKQILGKWGLKIGFIHLSAFSKGGSPLGNAMKKWAADKDKIKRIDSLDAHFGNDARRAYKNWEAKGEFNVINTNHPPTNAEAVQFEKLARTDKNLKVINVKTGHGGAQAWFHMKPRTSAASSKGSIGTAGDPPAAKSKMGTTAGITTASKVETKKAGSTTQVPGQVSTSAASGIQPCPNLAGLGVGTYTRKSGLSKYGGSIKPKTTYDEYKKHLAAQVAQVKKNMKGQRSLKYYKSLPPSKKKKSKHHKGVNNIKWAGKEVSTPFKVVRDESRPDRWFSPTNPGAKKVGKNGKLKTALVKTKGGTNKGWFRTSSQITHFTVHHGGASNMAAGGLIATFKTKGWISAFAVGGNGQIYQWCDGAIGTNHTGGKSLKTSTNSVSVGIDFLRGIGGNKSADKKYKKPKPLPAGEVPGSPGQFFIRRANLGWASPRYCKCGDRAAFEATFELIKWLTKRTKITTKYCAADYRIDGKELRKASIHAHCQIQNGRKDGMNFIIWLMGTSKGTPVRVPKW